MERKGTELTSAEAELLASLPNDPAYILLLNKLGFIVDNLTDDLHEAAPQQAAELLPYWKAMRSIYVELRDTPGEVGAWLANTRKPGLSPDTDPRINQVLQTYLAKLSRTQQDAKQREDDVFNTYGTPVVSTPEYLPWPE